MKVRALLSFSVTSAVIAAFLLTAAVAEGELTILQPAPEGQAVSVPR